jgi:membrane-bound lytic murein transglycosylase B
MKKYSFFLGIYNALVMSVFFILASCSTTKTENAPDQKKSATVNPPPSDTKISGVSPAPALAQSSPLTFNEQVKMFIQRMVVQHHFNEQSLTTLLQSASIKENILKRISSPAEALPWYKYRKIFLTDARIQGGVKFWHDNAKALSHVSTQTGVPAEIIVAIIGVETGYGKNMGSERVLDALSTLAFAYPPRSAFFTSELENFLLLCREEHINPNEPLGSYAGAMGYPQFMPSSFRTFAKDYNDDNQRDIWHNPSDAIASVANYFIKHDWQRGQEIALPVTAIGNQYKSVLDKGLKPNMTIAQLSRLNVSLPADLPSSTPAKLLAFDQTDKEELWVILPNFYVITRYNHSPLYALAAYQLSQEIKQQL